MNISKALDEMQSNKKHMVIVTRNDDNNTDNKNKTCIGIITLEDIIEYILKEDIFDEDEKKILVKDNKGKKVHNYKSDKLLNTNEINAIASYFRMNFKPFQNLNKLVSCNNDDENKNFILPKEIIEKFIEHCEIKTFNKYN